MERVLIKKDIIKALREVGTPEEEITKGLDILIEEEILARREKDKQAREEREQQERKEEKEREHELRKLQMEKEKKEKDLEIARLNKESPGVTPTSSISTFAKQERKSWNPDNESLSDFLQEFETWAAVCQQSEHMKAMTIKQLIPASYLTIVKSIPQDKAYDYKYIKESLLQSTGSNEHQLRAKFEDTTPEENDQWRLFITRTHNNLVAWIKSAKIGETYDDLLVYFAYLKAAEGMPKHFKAQLAKEYKADIPKLGEIGEEHLSHYHPNVPLKKLFQKPKQPQDPEKKSPPTKRRFNHHQDDHKNGKQNFSSVKPQFDSTGNITKPPPHYSKISQPCINHPHSRHRTDECRLNHASSSSRSYNHPQRSGTAVPLDYAQRNQPDYRSHRSPDFQNNNGEQHVYQSNHVKITYLPMNLRTEEPSVLEPYDILKPPIDFRDAPMSEHQAKSIACSITETVSDTLPKAQLKLIKGTVNGHPVKILLDDGCESIIVNKNLINPEDISSNMVQLDSIHGSSRAPIASCYLHCDYFSGKTNVAAAKDLHYDVMMGEVPGVKPFPKTRNSLTSIKAQTEALPKQDLQKSLPLIKSEYDPYTHNIKFQPKAEEIYFANLPLSESTHPEDLEPLIPALAMEDEKMDHESPSKPQIDYPIFSSCKQQEPDLVSSPPSFYPEPPRILDEDELETPTFLKGNNDSANIDASVDHFEPKTGRLTSTGLCPGDISFKNPFPSRDKGTEGTKMREDAVLEKVGNISDCPKIYSLAHCISADADMSQGIALDFKRNFSPTQRTLKQNKNPGEVATTFDDGRYIYHLVTKKLFYDKATFRDLKKSLEGMLLHANKFGITDIALSRIGFRIDSLSWKKVKNIINEVFSDSNFRIHVYHQDLG